MKNINTTFTANDSCAEWHTGQRVAVLLPLPLASSYTYLVGDESVVAGGFVEVPLGNRTMTGVVWGSARDDLPTTRLKSIRRCLTAPPMSEVTRRFVDWVASYTLSPPGAVLKMAMSVPAALEPVVESVVYTVAPSVPDMKMTATRRAFLTAAQGLPPLPLSALAQRCGVGLSVVKAVQQAGGLVALSGSSSSCDRPDGTRIGPVLSPAQAAAAESLIASIQQGFCVHVMDGVTGSGKTEVYFEVIAHTLRQGRQVLVLLPEIALSAQWLNRFRDRFGASPVLWHSEVPAARRRDHWRAVAEGQAQVIVGARSALFLPFTDLAAIIVDEEHEAAFKQEDGVMYHARDMAVVRGHLGGCPVVLASATPSLESWNNVQTGRYNLLHLPDRHGGAGMPHIGLIDMRTSPPPRGFWLSPPLVEAITQTLEQREQVMLYLNRRGYAPLTLCRSCGHRLQCPNCTAWLVEHRHTGRLCCHHCGHSLRYPSECPQCQAEDSLVPCGPGIERIVEEIKHRFPDIQTATMASDTITSSAALQDLIQHMQDRSVDVLVGTQMMAKGHHFPWLTLVGVVDADLGLEGGELRAAERTHQMLSQVAGRAGRAERPGRVYLQTWDPAHPVMTALAAGDRDGFMQKEAQSRQMAGMPPFGRLIALIISATTAEGVENYCRDLSRRVPPDDHIEVMGPAAAAMAVLRGRHRRRFLVKGSRRANLQAYVKQWLSCLPPPSTVRVQIDVDPVSFF